MNPPPPHTSVCPEILRQMLYEGEVLEQNRGQTRGVLLFLMKEYAIRLRPRPLSKKIVYFSNASVM